MRLSHCSARDDRHLRLVVVRATARLARNKNLKPLSTPQGLIEGIGAMKVDWLHRVNGRGMLDEASLRGAPTMGSGGLFSKNRYHQRFQAGHC